MRFTCECECDYRWGCAKSRVGGRMRFRGRSRPRTPANVHVHGCECECVGRSLGRPRPSRTASGRRRGSHSARTYTYIRMHVHTASAWKTEGLAFRTAARTRTPPSAQDSRLERRPRGGFCGRSRTATRRGWATWAGVWPLVRLASGPWVSCADGRRAGSPWRHGPWCRGGHGPWYRVHGTGEPWYRALKPKPERRT